MRVILGVPSSSSSSRACRKPRIFPEFNNGVAVARRIYRRLCARKLCVASKPITQLLLLLTIAGFYFGGLCSGLLNNSISGLLISDCSL